MGLLPREPAARTRCGTPSGSDGIARSVKTMGQKAWVLTIPSAAFIPALAWWLAQRFL
jgi:hypothetical protein